MNAIQQKSHNTVAVLQGFAANAHAAAATAHGNGDYSSEDELTKQAISHTLRARELESRQLHLSTFNSAINFRKQNKLDS